MFVHKTTDIARELGIPANKLTSLIRNTTTAFATDKHCANCAGPYPLTSRTAFTERRAIGIWICELCREEKKKAIAQQVQAEKEAKQELIYQYWRPDDKNLRVPEDFSLRDVVFFLSMIRGGANEDYQYIIPISSFQEPLAPEEDFTFDILKYLYRRDILIPHPGSSVDAFSFSEEGSTFNLEKVFWVRPKWADLREATNFFESLIKDDRLPEEWEKDVSILWREIILQEGLELLRYYTSEHGFYLKVGEKTVDVLTNILEDYNIAQLQNFLWRASKDAAAYYMRGNVSKPQAANSVITRLQGDFEKSRADNWDIKPYGRLFNLPQSVVSTVFFNAVMKMPNTYRESIPPG